MFLSFILVILGVLLLFKILFSKKKTYPQKQSAGEVLNNKYIINHEQKMKDDEEYNEYLEWCKFKGELPAEKEGFDDHRMQEFQMYKKLLKHGINGIEK